MILIGSSAIKSHYTDFHREPKDIDYAIKGTEIKSDNTQSKRIEYLINPVLFDYVSPDETVLSPNLLYTLKMSHLFWDINWDKHMYDLQFLKKKGCQLNLPAFLDLYLYWNEYHGKNTRSDLKMSAEDFFDNALKCDYAHDDIHTLLQATPTYTKVLIGEVEVGEDKFNDLSFDEKCDLVREEVMVMAWERYPKNDYRVAYSKMLKKFIISHAPIWEAIFIIENYITLHKPNINYFNIINNGLHNIKSKAI